MDAHQPIAGEQEPMDGKHAERAPEETGSPDSLPHMDALDGVESTSSSTQSHTGWEEFTVPQLRTIVGTEFPDENNDDLNRKDLLARMAELSYEELGPIYAQQFHSTPANMRTRSQPPATEAPPRFRNSVWRRTKAATDSRLSELEARLERMEVSARKTARDVEQNAARFARIESTLSDFTKSQESVNSTLTNLSGMMATLLNNSTPPPSAPATSRVKVEDNSPRHSPRRESKYDAPRQPPRRTRRGKGHQRGSNTDTSSSGSTSDRERRRRKRQRYRNNRKNRGSRRSSSDTSSGDSDTVKYPNRPATATVTFEHSETCLLARI